MKNLENCLQIAAATDVGCVRANNEDSIGHELSLGIVVLADGVGGHKAGEVASAMAVGIILNELSSLRDLPTGEIDPATELRRETVLVCDAIRKANEAIYTTATRQPNYEGMGTTVAMALFYDNRVTIAHVGDSRVYRLRQGELRQMTRDHSLVAELLERGYFKSWEEAASAGLENAITRSLGLEEDVKPDLREETVQAGDLYLLSSDGLTDMVDDPNLQAILERHAEQPNAAIEELIAMAKEKGGRDNISAIIVRSLQAFPPWQSLPWHRKIFHWFAQHFHHPSNNREPIAP
jgi:protein phosphatase